ncbi:MAG TPA: hypothetical protein VG734_04685 [Lacunisphaera sp.]|nr:hypothetical protein [Lacunisphaera sp.]
MKTFLARRWLLALVTLAVGAGIVFGWQLGVIALRPMAIYSGWLLMALVLVLTFFNARKKLPFLPLLSASAWMQAHIYLGWLGCFVFVLHTGGRMPDGRLEVVLAAVFGVVAASGAFGLWLSRWLPPRLVRSGESLVYERIPSLRHQLANEVKEVVRRAEVEAQSSTLPDLYLRVLHPYFLRVPPLLAPLTGDARAAHHVRQELESARRYLNPAELNLAGELDELVEAKRNLDTQLAGQRLLKLWLFLHLPLTYAMLVLIAAHVWVALQYSHRL